MKTSSKNRISIISIIVSFMILVGAIFGVAFMPKTQPVQAEEYNYGNFNDSGYYTLNGVVFYAVKVKNVKDKLISNISEDEKFTINSTEYQFVETRTKVKKGEEVVSDVLNNIFTIDGTSYKISDNKIYENYWADYEIVKDSSGKPETIKFGETVLVESDEAILICFARQTDDGSGLVLNEDGSIISSSIDFLGVNVKVNDIDEEDENENSLSSGVKEIKEFGYIIDPNGKVTNSGGLGVNAGNEGKVEFLTKDYEVGNILQSYSFMFYIFKQGTYHRQEALDETAPDSIKERPNTEIFNTTYVTDASTRANFFSEHFYNYSSQNLPYLEFDISRYDVSITKSIHRTATTYTFTIDNSATDSQTTETNKKITRIVETAGEKKVVQQIEQQLSTMDIYARGLRVEVVSGTKIRIYFEDLGVYAISYTAVYYEGEQKINLDTLNTDKRQDCLTIFGTELTYQDSTNGQTPFRNESNTIYADVTGVISVGEGISGDNTFNKTNETNGELTLSSGFVVAGTNQPPVKILFNAPVEGEFNVYYSTDGKTFEKNTSYSYTSNFENPGYYFIEIKTKFEDYKKWVAGASQTEDKISTQYYLFQVKELSSTTDIFVLDDNGNVPSGEKQRVYNGVFVKNGIQIVEFEQASEFDSEIYFELTYKKFGQTANQSITFVLPNEKASALTSEQKTFLLSYGIEKFDDGYYVLKPREAVDVDGEYSLTLRYGKVGKETTTFKLDTEQISGLSTYFVESVYGSDYYRSNLISGQGQIALTNSDFTIMWNNKKSGANVQAKFVRFALSEKTFKEDANDYIFNTSWLATDYGVMLSDANPETIFTRANSVNEITASSVLTSSGLYIFKLEDEAGNVGYYSVMYDTTIPIVLQKEMNTSNPYEKVSGANNVSKATTIFFGSHKAIPFYLNNNLISQTEIDTYTGSKASEYFKILLNNLSTIDATNIVSQNESAQYFISIPIKNIYETAGNVTTKLSSEIINQGYYDRLMPTDENGRMKDMVYFYQIFDKSNTSISTPTKTHKLRFNTDTTGLLIYTDKDNLSSSVDLYNSQTKEDYTERAKYYLPTTSDSVYLSWDSLKPDGLNAYVDIANDGLICEYYALVYDAEKHSYCYSETPTIIDLKLLTLSDEQILKGYEGNSFNVQILINPVEGKTAEGKYVITRKYSPVLGTELGDLGYDFETVKTVFFVDRSNIISPNDSNNERNGYYTFITTFDGGDENNKIFFEELYRQSQTSGNYILKTNQLPIGFYIPKTKYGTFYKVENNVLTDIVADINFVEQNNNATSIQFVDLIKFTGLDRDVSAGLGTEYSPFELSVVLKSPETTVVDGKTVNLYYYYSLCSDTGYYMISGYSYGELAPDETPISISNPQSFITNNPLKGTAEYADGNYELQIGAIRNSELNSYNQKFKVIINVQKNSPDYDINAEYSELENMEERELVSDGTNFYTNTNELKFVWTNSSNQYYANIDLSKIEISYYTSANGTRQTTIPAYDERILVHEGSRYYTFENGIETDVDVSNINDSIYVLRIEKNDTSLSFIYIFPEDTTKIVVKMAFEKYSSDAITRYYTPYYGTAYQSNRTIIIDRNAPTSSITSLISDDKTIEGVALSALRESTDSRFSKSATTGAFKYYTFIATKDYLNDLSKTLSGNEPTETKLFYFRQFNSKYTSSNYETGLAYDKTSRADNLFSEYFAISNGWEKVSSEINLEFSGYYEIVELDLAGNQTIYSIYVGEGRELELKLTGGLENYEFDGTLKISKGETGITANLIQTPPKTFDNISISNPVSISAYNKILINYIKMTNDGNEFYRFMKLSINGKLYFITPDSFTKLTPEGSEIACTRLYTSLGEKIELANLELNGQASSHNITFTDTVNLTDNSASLYSINAKVSDINAKLTDNGGAQVLSDVKIVGDGGNIVSSENITLIVTTELDPSLTIDPSSIRIFKIASDGSHICYKILETESYEYSNIETYEVKTSNSVIKYFYIPADRDFVQSTFYILFKDNFGKEYKFLKEYRESIFNRFEGEYDITDELQNSTDITVSGNVVFNYSNLYIPRITVDGQTNPSCYQKVDSSLLGGSYSQYRLLASTDEENGYVGNKRVFKIELFYNTNSLIDYIINEGFTAEESGIIETIYVTIINVMPNIKVTDINNVDITEKLFSKTITQSQAITISFGSGNTIMEEAGITSKVFLRLRGSEEGYFEIASPYVVNEAGVYDLLIQNYDSNGNAFDYTISHDFVISDLDLMFYTVVKTNENGEQEIVSPTGNVYEYSTNNFASYHYIVNTNEWDVITNGVNVTKTLIFNHNNTSVYEITSVSGTIYKARIAITVVQKTNDILVGNPFIWYKGKTYSAPSDNNYIRSTSKEIFLCVGDVDNEITLRYASYFGITQNKIICYVSSDEGETWTKVKGTDNGETTTIVLENSASLLFKFEDIAGNIQHFSSATGYPSSTTKVNFIRSVIIRVNGDLPIENAIYNGEVVITLPIGTSHFYSTTPEIKVYRNNSEYTISSSLGVYKFTESGTYRVSFSAKVENGTKDLNQDVFKFTIINSNDSRWVFNYINYNDYEITSIKYNGVELSENVKNRALSVENEINISTFDVDSLGNKWFDNGLYTITMRDNGSEFGEREFEFSFWLNTATVPISISLPEGETTTGSVTIELNKANLYETLGDCYVKINNKVIYEINETTVSGGNEPYKLSGVGSYYIQVYTSSGKLVYSYRVNIKEPLNTVTIILIVVSVVVVAVGLLIFFLLRKKLRVR
ncbi:MAG: hypothetical protein ACI4L1_03930 [Christensenellales bacterium]